MPLPSVEKDPAAKLDYGFDWAAWLGTDTITASEWSVAPAGPVLSGETFDANSTSVFMAGGTVGNSYTLSNKITTAAGRIDERSIKIKVKDQ
jgi:hypothetical protein